MNKHWALVFVLLLSTGLILTQGQAQTTPTTRLERQVGLGSLLDVVFLRDNNSLISSGSRGMTYWDAATRKKIRTVEADGNVNQVVVSRDGKWLAAAINNGVALYEAPTGKFVTKLMNISSQAVAFSPNNKWLATGSDDGIVRLWDMATRKASAIVEFYDPGKPQPTYHVKTLVFDAVSQTIVGDATTIQPESGNSYLHAFFAMEMSKRKFVRVMGERGLSPFAPISRYSPSGIAFHPDNKTYYLENGIYILPDTRPKLKFNQPLFFSQDWKVAVNRTGTVINPANGQSILQLDLPVQPGDPEVAPDHWAFSPDGRYLVAALKDQRMLFYDAKRFVFLGDIREHQPAMQFMALHPTLPIAALSEGFQSGQKVRLVNLETGELSVQIIPSDTCCLPLSFSTQGNILLAGRTGINFKPNEISPEPTEAIDLYSPGSDYIGPVVWTPDGTQILMHKDSNIFAQPTDRTNFSNEVVFASTEGAMSDIDGWVNITISNDGKFVAVAGDDGVARVFDVATKKIVARLIHPSAVIDVAFSSNSKELYTRSLKGLNKWNTVTWDEMGKLTFQNQTTALAVGTGNLVAVSANTSKENVYLISTDTMKIMARLQHSGVVDAMGFAPNGQRLITAARDGSIWIWRIQK